MRRYVVFLLAGTLFSTVEELLTVAILRGDVGAYLFTLIVLFPAILSVDYFLSRLLDRFPGVGRRRDALQLVIGGAAGLMFEWFAMGLSPWSNPDAHPVGMAIFQIGMFSFWATLTFAPELFIRSDRQSRNAKRILLRGYIPYFALVYLVVLAIPRDSRFGLTIGLIVLGYTLTLALLVRYVATRSFNPQPRSG